MKTNNHKYKDREQIIYENSPSIATKQRLEMESLALLKWHLQHGCVASYVCKMLEHLWTYTCLFLWFSLSFFLLFMCIHLFWLPTESAAHQANLPRRARRSLHRRHGHHGYRSPRRHARPLLVLEAALHPMPLGLIMTWSDMMVCFGRYQKASPVHACLYNREGWSWHHKVQELQLL